MKRTKNLFNTATRTNDKKVLNNEKYMGYGAKHISDEIQRWLMNCCKSNEDWGEMTKTLNENQMELIKQLDGNQGGGYCSCKNKREANKLKEALLVESMLQNNFKWAIWQDLKEHDEEEMKNYKPTIHRAHVTTVNLMTGETEQEDFETVY